MDVHKSLRPARRWIAWGATAGVALLAAAMAPAWGQARPGAVDPTRRPTDRVDNCTDGGCHAESLRHAHLHGPVAVGACDVCHSYADRTAHTFQLKRPEEELCGFCHISQAVHGAIVHEPVRSGQCLGCHDPHGGTTRELFRQDDLGKLCASCHDDMTRGREHVHGPAGAGSCAACHAAHTAEHEKLLIQPGRALCLSCHEDMLAQIDAVRNVHEPARGDCLQCHEAHASQNPMHLVQPPAQLCASCHEDVTRQAGGMRHQHSPVSDARACLNCHTAHGGDLDGLMAARPVTVCMTCHDQPVDGPGGVVPAVPELLDPAGNRHGPIRDGTCTGCHFAHGAEQARLLSEPYPQTFYEHFAAQTYALCFSCHDAQLALQPQTTRLTGFRDGDRNLHYSHVNKAKGRSCRACHSTHASGNPVHIRESVPFGNWQMPVNFTPTDSGGRCASGCHRELEYSREEPPAPGGPQTAQPHTTPSNAANGALPGRAASTGEPSP